MTSLSIYWCTIHIFPQIRQLFSICYHMNCIKFSFIPNEIYFAQKVMEFYVAWWRTESQLKKIQYWNRTTKPSISKLIDGKLYPHHAYCKHVVVVYLSSFLVSRNFPFSEENFRLLPVSIWAHVMAYFVILSWHITLVFGIISCDNSWLTF